MDSIKLELSQTHTRVFLHLILLKMEEVSKKDDKEMVENVLSHYRGLFDYVETNLNEQLYGENKITWTNEDGTEESQWNYEINGQPLSSNNKIPYFELDRIREELEKINTEE